MAHLKVAWYKVWKETFQKSIESLVLFIITTSLLLLPPAPTACDCLTDWTDWTLEYLLSALMLHKPIRSHNWVTLEEESVIFEGYLLLVIKLQSDLVFIRLHGVYLSTNNIFLDKKNELFF
jgi:hypothetical protein